MLRTSLTQSAQNLPLSMDRAEDAKVGSGTSFTTRSAKNLPSGMVEDAEVGGNGNDEDDEMVKNHLLPKCRTDLPEHLTSLRSKKRWVSLDSFGYSWGSQLEVLSEWLQAKFAGLLAQGYKEQSSSRATQGSYPNQSLRKLTFHRYNKLNSLQVCRTY